MSVIVINYYKMQSGRKGVDKMQRGNNECEWEKAEKIRDIESIMLDMLIIY